MCCVSRGSKYRGHLCGRFRASQRIDAYTPHLSLEGGRTTTLGLPIRGHDVLREARGTTVAQLEGYGTMRPNARSLCSHVSGRTMPRFAVRELPGGNGRAVAVEATSCSSTRVYARLAETASGPSGPHFPDRQREKGVQTGALKVSFEALHRIRVTEPVNFFTLVRGPYQCTCAR